VKFAFYGRVSTEDNQDPEESRRWQLYRCRQLIEQHDGEIVAEFFDIGQSRSLPWERRPQASALLSLCRRRDRSFEAIVIAEPQRAFYDHQFGDTFPQLNHYGVGLWVPELNGPVDPKNRIHRRAMNQYGEDSWGERDSIRQRVQTSMTALAATGERFLGGRPPYGYRLANIRQHPNPKKARDGKQLRDLEIDPVTAPVIRRIFTEYLDGRGLMAIAEGLTRDRIPSPSAYDPSRNRHRSGEAWSKPAIRAIIQNPVYTGHKVWNRQRREEVLLDPSNVALGYRTVQRWNEPEKWIWSPHPTHPAIIPRETFDQAQRHRAAGRNRPVDRQPRKSKRLYVLSGLISCGICGRRMEGTYISHVIRYRCSYPLQYALLNEIEHPRTVYVREDELLPALDEWLIEQLKPANAPDIIELLMAAPDPDPATTARREQAKRQLADAGRKLAKHREAIEAGVDPRLVSTWISETQATKLRAEAILRDTAPTVPSERHLRAAVEEVTDLADQLRTACHEDKQALYRALPLRASYLPQIRAVDVRIYTNECVGEGT
jgi:site-specific DNA recombinase